MLDANWVEIFSAEMFPRWKKCFVLIGFLQWQNVFLNLPWNKNAKVPREVPRELPVLVPQCQWCFQAGFRPPGCSHTHLCNSFHPHLSKVSEEEQTKKHLGSNQIKFKGYNCIFLVLHQHQDHQIKGRTTCTGLCMYALKMCKLKIDAKKVGITGRKSDKEN